MSRAYPGTKKGFECPTCEEVIFTQPHQIERWRFPDDEYDDDLSGGTSYYYSMAEPEHVTLEICPGCDNDITEDYEMVEIWFCGECETGYADKEDAKTCCL